MRKLKYNIGVFLAFFTMLSYAQKFENKFSKEITIKKGIDVSLIANYADIEIVEWSKDKVQVDAVMTVKGVSKEVAQTYFDTWEIDLTKEKDGITIISKSKNRFPELIGYVNDIDLDAFVVEMPEISIESLGVLDSMNFSFPEINFEEILNDSTFNKIYTYNFGAELDSLSKIINEFDFEKLKENQKYLQEWQEANKDNFIKLREKALELALKNREKAVANRVKLVNKREEASKKRAKAAKRRVKEALKRAKEAMKKSKNKSQKIKKRHKKIKEILKNRKETKVRTKLIIRVPKNTDFNMNVNYSKIRTN